MQQPTLYRNRLIPLESVLLSQDRILYRDSTKLITAWDTLHPKSDLAYGYSCYYLDRGFKISRFYSHSHEFMFWYCDIIETEYQEDTDTYIFTDLLADVIVKPDGSNRVLDLDELSEALERGLVSPQQTARALRRLDDLLQIIYRDRFEALTEPLLKMAEQHARS